MRGAAIGPFAFLRRRRRKPSTFSKSTCRRPANWSRSWHAARLKPNSRAKPKRLSPAGPSEGGAMYRKPLLILFAMLLAWVAPPALFAGTEITAVAFTSDGRTLISVGLDGAVVFWDVA